MPQTNETPPVEGGSSCESCAGLSHDIPSPHVIQLQFLIATHAIRPELAVMLAALLFGGARHD